MSNSVYIAGVPKFDLQKHIHNETYSTVSNKVLQEIYLKPYDEISTENLTKLEDCRHAKHIPAFTENELPRPFS